MPVLVKPTSDASRLNLLNSSLNASKTEVKSGNPYLSETTLSQISSVSEEFDSKIKDETGMLAERSKEVREKNEAIVALEVTIRDLWEVIKRRVYRKNEPAEVLNYYQLPLDGTVPKVITEKEIFTLAGKIIEGDKKAITAGYAAAVCPSATELNDVLIAAKKEADEVAQADRNYNQTQKALAPIRSKADELITDIIDELEYNLRKLDPSHKRRIMRSYGVTYRYAAGESEEEATTGATETKQ